MPQNTPLTCYLAGPISNCNDAQKSKWRRELTEMLGANWKCIDPVQALVPWTPYREFELINTSHVVVANLWKESIGTVLGIMQARRLGKPVILATPTHIESSILDEIVGKENRTDMLTDVPLLLDLQRTFLTQEVMVSKRSSGGEVFDSRKLIESISRACSDSGLNDDWLPTSIARSIHLSLVTKSKFQITTDEVKSMVWEKLDELANTPDATYGEELKEKAKRAKLTWADREKIKDTERYLNSECVALQAQRDEYKARFEDAERELARAKHDLEECRRTAKAISACDTPNTAWEEKHGFVSVTDALDAAKIDFGDFLTFSDDVDDTAAECPFKDPDRVYRALLGLAQYSRDKREGCQMGLREWCTKNMPYEYAPCESESTSNNPKLISRRKTTFQGKEVKVEEHLKLGIGGKNTCCRIHFKNRTSEDSTVLIGLITEHLPTSRRN